MELSGTYNTVVKRLDTADDERPALDEVTEDFDRLLDTVADIGGGTKSVILENLPADMAVEYGSDTVVTALQVLESCGLVTLEGNTWKSTQ